MRLNPALAVNRAVNVRRRVLLTLSGLAVAVTMVQLSAARRRGRPPEAART